MRIITHDDPDVAEAKRTITMLLQPIDIKRAKAGFPSIFTVFGNRLDQQIDAFNKAVGANQVPSHLSMIVYGRMGAYGFANPHRPVLLALSALHAPGQFPPAGVAPLFLLEAGLRQSLRQGDKQSTYESMLRLPGSYSDLIGELDWVTQLRAAGATLKPHAPTPGQQGNFDIDCELAAHRLMGDVKWFQNWLVKPRGDNPLVGQIMLLQPDLAREIVVKSRVRVYSQDYILLRGRGDSRAVSRRAGRHIDRAFTRRSGESVHGRVCQRPGQPARRERRGPYGPGVPGRQGARLLGGIGIPPDRRRERNLQ